jgi:hypothetical protein
MTPGRSGGRRRAVGRALVLSVLLLVTGMAAGAGPSAAGAPTALSSAGAPCTPRFDSGVDDEPWRGKRRASSERLYTARMKQEHPAYVRGRNGWQFLGDRFHENFSQAVGRTTLSGTQRRAWARWFRHSQRVVERAGGRYFVVVAPAKWDVYSHKLPRWAQRLRGTTSLDAMLAEHPDLPWIDTRAALRREARRHDTYEPLNSHWTPYGGYVAWKAVARCLRASGAELAAVDVPPITGVGAGPSPNEFGPFGVPDGPPRSTYPVYAAPHPETTMTHLPDGAPMENAPDHVTDVLWSPLRTDTPQAQAPGVSMLTLRDSMGSALSPLWSTSFGTTFQYAHGINQMGFSPPDLAALVAAYQPRLVLFVITERWLHGRPPA